ncbi:hypothetical protein GCM10018966_062730 [Streptomyces yanii]
MQKLVRHLKQKKEAALARHGPKLWEYEILWCLRSAGESYRMAPTRLAQGLGVHPATLTNRLDRTSTDWEQWVCAECGGLPPWPTSASPGPLILPGPNCEIGQAAQVSSCLRAWPHGDGSLLG